MTEAEERKKKPGTFIITQYLHLASLHPTDVPLK